MSTKVNIKRDGDFTYVEVKEDGHRVAHYTIENEFAPAICRALLGLECQVEMEPLFDQPAGCHFPEQCRYAGHCCTELCGDE